MTFNINKSCLIVALILFASPIFAKDDPYLEARQKMLDKDLRGRDIVDERVLNAMGKAPRHLFVDDRLRKVAYADRPLPIGEGQTISQPYIVALMTQVLDAKPGQRVLEIGTGSGYQAAVLAELTGNVYSIEIRKGLAEKAKSRLKELGYKNVEVKSGDGYFGWEEHAPFDSIIITCAANHIPAPLIIQMKEGGKLLIPLGNTNYYQTLTLVTKVKGELSVEYISGVVFVPMIGEAMNKR